jgi:N-acyl-D-aspartate/D-glutamate deacylase
MGFDLVIRNGLVVDGTGGEAFEADVAIEEGRIAAIGRSLGRGAEEIDAKGKLVTPGFVDIHTHYDGQAVWSDRLAPSSSHGVTTAATAASASRPAAPSTASSWSASWRASRTSPRW